MAIAHPISLAIERGKPVAPNEICTFEKSPDAEWRRTDAL
jgi:hypothetical protein